MPRCQNLSPFISESKNTFALEQKAIVVSFAENVAFLLGHPVQYMFFSKKGNVHGLQISHTAQMLKERCEEVMKNVFN